MYFKIGDVAGLKLFYREAGDPSKPTIVLLHGFPSSSYQFHNLIPLLADRFHVIAPDYPRHGVHRRAGPDRPATDLRRRGQGHRRLHRPARARATHVYLHDIGGPIGMRIAMAHPERIEGLIFQNFTTSVEGWNPERLEVYKRSVARKPQRSWPRPSNFPPWNAACFSTRRARANPTV